MINFSNVNMFDGSSRKATDDERNSANSKINGSDAMSFTAITKDGKHHILLLTTGDSKAFYANLLYATRVALHLPEVFGIDDETQMNCAFLALATKDDGTTFYSPLANTYDSLFYAVKADMALDGITNPTKEQMADHTVFLETVERAVIFSGIDREKVDPEKAQELVKAYVQAKWNTGGGNNV